MMAKPILYLLDGGVPELSTRPVRDRPTDRSTYGLSMLDWS